MRPARALPSSLKQALALPEQKPGPDALEVEIDVAPWLFGGGVKPRESDPLTRVRPASVLGAVQACWRLLAEAKDLDTLRTQERAVFGGAGTAAPFRLAVTKQRPGKEVPAPGINASGGYLAFPAREERTTRRPAMTLWSDVGARLTFLADREPTLPESLRRAVELWLLIGGVGGRTRRGLGAVQARNGDLEVKGVDDLGRRLHRLLDSAPRAPKCNGTVRSVREVWLTEASFQDANTCLAKLEAWYRSYRQDRRPPKAGGRPGRSYWDEPEQIRCLTRRRDPSHPPLPMAPNRHPPGFARAALGLPIVFHFKDRGDPPTTTLVGQKAKPSTDRVERLASPLWFRPVRVGEKEWVGLVLLTSAPYLPPGGLLLTDGNNHRWPPPGPPDVERVFRDLLDRPVAGKPLRPVIP